MCRAIIQSAMASLSPGKMIHTFTGNSETTKSWGAALILLAILQTLFWPCVWGGRTFLEGAQDAPSILRWGAEAGPAVKEPFLKVPDPGAPAWQSEPWFAFIRDQYRQGEIPLWNPYQAFGEPFAANMQSQPFYPLTFSLCLRLTPRTYNFYILARLFAAGLLTYFYLRLFLSFTASISGGICYMLTGYYILHHDHPHLSVEILLPAVLLTGEHLLARPAYKTVVWLAIAVMLVFLGGMPESNLLLLTFAAAYLAFRILSDSRLRLKWMRLMGLLSVSAIAGVGLSSLVLVPFYEYVVRSYNVHSPPATPGLWADRLDLSALTYFFPLLFGPLYTSSGFVAGQVRNYVGLISVFLAITAVACTLRRRTNQDRSLDARIWFFAGAVVIMLLKKYGSGAIHWTGTLPFYHFVDFRKFDEPVIAFSMWVLSAIGIERLKRREASRLVLALAFVAAALVLGTAAVVSRSGAVKALAPDRISEGMSQLAIRVPAILMLGLLAALILDWSFRRKSGGSLLGVAVAVLITAELSFNYIIPVYRTYNQLPSMRRNPYAGAAFIRFLQARNEGEYRVFGRDWVLTPNWASVFRVFDIRDMDALYYNKYFPFLRTFLHLTDHSDMDLISVFYGSRPYNFRLPLEKRLLQFGSVKYLMTQTPFVTPNARVDEILRQNQGHLQPGKEKLVGRTAFLLGGSTRESLGEHPPYERLPYDVKVGPGQGRFHFSYALNPAVFDKTNGQGVRFTIEVRDRDGKIDRLFSNYIDPKHNPQQRRWMDGEIDLRRYRGQQVTLLFSTAAGSRGNTSYDWASWSDLRFEDEPNETAGEFKLVYDADAKIYEYDDVLPRAAIYYDADVEKDDSAVLRKLADPSLEVFRTVVLDASELSKHQAAAAAMLNDGITRVDAGRIRSYESQAVEIEATLQRRGILVLNDSNYPGWKVLIDGQPGEWFPANYLFRGVFLNAGTHVVRFEYRPKSFYLGTAISFLTFVLLAGFGFMRLRVRNQGGQKIGRNAPEVGS